MASKMADSSSSSSTPGSTHGATSATARSTSTVEEDTLNDVEDESDRASLSSTEAELDSTVSKFRDRCLPKKRKALASGEESSSRAGIYHLTLCEVEKVQSLPNVHCALVTSPCPMAVLMT